ncbi:MAG: hypothetical protein ALECFALPRED_000826 [Alectoria fallacina]|uniref:Uncharacterized protein n=1 Tax=Alectoria fallacina TaxID=1903189 RepID=A0A8H3F6U0_9LECA|nr:MAG: hypothetical protein ALECFALPRED_000826 [Alectoria fallacina]
MASDTTISIIALAVALVALVTTISQVLGQFLATADGYRRCQSSVMGGWAKLTHRKFRWSEMRFETIYTTPQFGLFPYMPGQSVSKETDSYGTKETRFQLDGSAWSKEARFYETPRGPHLAGGTENVSWLRFIEALHRNSQESLILFGVSLDDASSKKELRNRTNQIVQEKILDDITHHAFGSHVYLIPDLKMQRRSWDFVPPEVTRPLASITVCDLAVMARRLGMMWKQFEPLDGNFRAEGNGHTITSTAVRSMGTVLQIGVKDFLPSTDPTEELNELYIPSEAADKMGFGIVSGEASLGVPDYKLGTEEEVLATLRNVVDPSREAAERVKGILGANPGWTPGISDIIGFAAPMMRQSFSSIVRVPQPAGYAVGLTQQQEGFVVFHKRLYDLVAERDSNHEPVSEQTRSILHQYAELLSSYGEQWENHEVCNQKLNDRSVEFQDDLFRRHLAATKYFKDLMVRFNDTGENSQVFRYTDLMYSHIRHAVNYFPEALERINASPSRARDHYGMRVAGWIIEGAHIYFDNIPKVVEDMRSKGFDQPDIVEEAVRNFPSPLLADPYMI